ncbi:MAG: hypothetical protein Q4C87_02520 [Actinomycetaceae bacterium]|nr:hypothetical protein [Actinomycetaceae bacterium]
MIVDIPRAISRLGTPQDVISHVHSLGPEERAQWQKEVKRSLKIWEQITQANGNSPEIPAEEGYLAQPHTRTMGFRQVLSTRLFLVALALEVSPTTAIRLYPTNIGAYVESKGALDDLIQLIASQGYSWVDTFIAGILGTRTRARNAHFLIAPLIAYCDRPVPDNPPYIQGWAGRIPDPNTKWEQHFHAACALPGAFAFNPPDKQRYINDIREGITRLRQVEVTNDYALCDSALSIIERGERPSAQRQALYWIKGLGLEGCAFQYQQRLFTILPLVDIHVFRWIVALFPDITGADLTALIIEAFTRKEKSLAQSMLARITDAEITGDLIALLRDIARSHEPTWRECAQHALQSLGQAIPDEPDHRCGLWRAPSQLSKPLPPINTDADLHSLFPYSTHLDPLSLLRDSVINIYAREYQETRQPLNAVFATKALQYACHRSRADRENIAIVLLEAWDAGRLHSNTLLEAWTGPWWQKIADVVESLEATQRSANKVASLATIIAEGGGLALVWPLLAYLAEEVATNGGPGTSTVLEIVLRYLPEVRAAGVAVDLPATVALANRKGKTKAILTARQIVAEMEKYDGSVN